MHLSKFLKFDSATPNADVCIQYGANAIATDTRIFIVKTNLL
ncbi:DUF3172 domain-containing protein [Chlorogloeopsis sp. ULAP01]|nr:DUF3172 domain-containing protein [Chlorogloeopsis sp. ULAP01]MDM9381268.1 DUF3172 domain-containing protein [Chlorogloeopsis sp. ULAP01]